MQSAPQRPGRAGSGNGETVDVIERSPNLTHRVTRDLGRAIVRGEIGQDDAFPTEAELSLQFGVSRTAVREAVKMLSAKGLVSSKPRRGIRVMPEEAWNIFDPDLLTWSLEDKPTSGVVREFFQLRVAVEPEAAALAARYSTAEHKARIAEAIGRMRAASGFSEPALEADVDFHTALLYATENRFYIRLRDFIRTALTVTIQFTTPAAGDYEGVVDAHEKVLRDIESGDAESARTRMRKLIDDAYAVLEAGDAKRR